MPRKQLPRKQFDKLSHEEKVTILKEGLREKYHKDTHFTCIECAIIALCEDNGCITDEELINDTGLRHK